MAAGLCAFAAVLARELHETRVEPTPMLSRYSVVAVALPAWAVVALPAWLADPIDPTTTFGPAGASHLLLAGVVVRHGPESLRVAALAPAESARGDADHDPVREGIRRGAFEPWDGE